LDLEARADEGRHRFAHLDDLRLEFPAGGPLEGQCADGTTFKHEWNRAHCPRAAIARKV